MTWNNGAVRSFLSVVLSLAALVCAAASSLTAWVARHLVSSEGFAELVGPVIHDPELKNEMTQTASRQATDTIVNAVPLLSGLRSRIDSMIKGVLDVVANQEKYGPAAEQSLMSVHDSAFGPSHEAVLSLKPLSSLLVESVVSPIGLPTPESPDLNIPLGAPKLFGTSVFELMAQFAYLWPVFLAGAAVLALLAVVAARRRWLACGLLSLGLMAVGWVESALASQLPQRAGGVTADPLGSLFLRKTAELLVPSLQAEALWVVWAGAGLMALALIVGLSAKVRSHRYVTA